MAYFYCPYARFPQYVVDLVSQALPAALSAEFLLDLGGNGGGEGEAVHQAVVNVVQGIGDFRGVVRGLAGAGAVAVAHGGSGWGFQRGGGYGWGHAG